MALSSGQAQYVLGRLLRERVVSQAEIDRYLAGLADEIAQLEVRLYKLREAAGDGAARTSRVGGRKRRRAHTATLRSARATSSGIEAKRLGGRFAGLIRRLPEEQRRQYHDIKSTKGVEAAIRALQQRRK
jgi:hypothetical protein